jgi:hypothetical protein
VEGKEPSYKQEKNRSIAGMASISGQKGLVGHALLYKKMSLCQLQKLAPLRQAGFPRVVALGTWWAHTLGLASYSIFQISGMSRNCHQQAHNPHYRKTEPWSPFQSFLLS